MINLEEKFKCIKLLIFDLQGVLISNHSNFSENDLKEFHNIMSNFCDFARKNNFIVAIITGLTDKQLHKAICTKCTCDTLHATLDKVSQADKLLVKYNIAYDNIFYMGDDLFDIPLLKKAALSSAPENARREVKRIVDFICPGKNAEERLLFIQNSLSSISTII